MCHFFGRAIVFKEIDGSFGQPLIEEWFEFRESTVYKGLHRVGI